MAPEGFVEKALKQAHKAIRESGQYWPHAFLFDQERQVDVFVFEPEIMSSKSRRNELLRLLQAAAITGNWFVVFVSEVWTLPQEACRKSQKERPAIIRHGMHDHPQRIECLTVSVLGRGLEPMLGQQIYRKDKATGQYVFEQVQWAPSSGPIRHGRCNPDMTNSRKVV